MLNDDVWRIMDGSRQVGVVRESVVIAGQLTYSIFLHKGYVFSDDEWHMDDEWYMGDTINPQLRINQSSFTGLTFDDT